MMIEHKGDARSIAARHVSGGDDVTVNAVEDILRRYPQVFPVEVDRALMFLTSAPLLQRHALAARPGMAARIEEIRLDHARAFRSRLPLVLNTALILAMLAGIGWLIAQIT